MKRSKSVCILEQQTGRCFRKRCSSAGRGPLQFQPYPTANGMNTPSISLPILCGRDVSTSCGSIPLSFIPLTSIYAGCSCSPDGCLPAQKPGPCRTVIKAYLQSPQSGKKIDKWKKLKIPALNYLPNRLFVENRGELPKWQQKVNRKRRYYEIVHHIHHPVRPPVLQFPG